MRIVDVLFLGLLFHALLPQTSALLFGCHPSCSTCLGPNSNQCLTCTSALTPVNGSCLCPDGSYPTSGLISCASCSSACGTCTGPTSTSCTGCNSGTFLYNSVCYTNCTSTQYFNITNLACATCDPACLTCSGPTNQQCASCISGTLNNGVCTCSSGQYKDSNYMCQTCDSTCKECSGSSSTQCTACNSGMILQSNQCKCSLGTYMSTNPVSCLSCNSMCQGCTGPATTQCTSCKNNMVLGSDGQCKCSSGMYLDTSSISCLSCDTSCQECTGALNTQCSACKNNMQLVNGACGCSAGTYLDSGSMVCLPCYSSCQTCSGPNSYQCTSCDSSLTLISGQCKCTSGCTCPSGTYFDALSLTCLPCNAACVTCSGSAANQCLSCTSSQTLVNGVCKCSGSGCTCAAGTYFNSGTLDCDPCDSGCLTCDGASSSDCTSCKSNLQLSSKQCRCNPGTFLNTSVNTCIQCSSTCNTCSGGSDNQCIDCKNNMQFLSTNQCGCGTGTFADLGSFTCVNCDGSCVECSGPDSSQCTQCATNKVLQNNYCLDICNANQYRASDGSCQTCTSPCATCSGAGTNQCKSCFSGDDLISGQCVSRCYSTCSACTGSSYSECTQCKNTYSFLESGNNIGQCLQETPNGYYATVSNGVHVYLQKTAINNVLAYGSQVTQVIITMGTDISTDYATIISGITISMTFVSQQPQVYYPYTFQLSGDSQQIIITFQFSGHLLPGNLLTINYDDFKDDNSTNFYLINTQHQLKLLEYYQYSESTQAAINATSAANTAANQANGVFSVGSSLVVNSIHSMRSEIVQDMLAYFIYMNIDFPPNFISFMSGGESPFQLIFPNLGSSIVQSLTSNDDEAAEKESSQDFNNALGKYAPDHSFMINNGFTLFALVLFAGIVIVAELVRFSLRYVKKTKYPKFLNFLTRGFESASYALRWNFLVNQYIGIYIDMTFFGLLQIVNPPVFRAFVDYLQYTFGFIGLSSAFLGAVFMYVFTSKIFRILKKNKDVKEEDKNQNDANLLKRLGILFMTFYQDKRSRLNYPFLLLVRSFGFSLVLIFLQNYPLIQVLYVILATILVMAYLIRFKPLSSKSQQILTIVYEGLFLVACIMALTLHIYNQHNLSNITVRSNLGFVLCACSLSMVILNFTSIIMELLKFKEFLKLRKATTTQVKPFIADVSKTNSEMPFKLIRNASILDNPDSTKRGPESWKEISFSQVPTVREDVKLAPPENNEEDNWLKDNATPKEIKDMSPDLIVAKNLMELHGVYGGSNESMVFEKPLLPTNQLRKRQLFTKRTVQFEGSYDESRNIKLIQHIQEINVGRLRDSNSQDNNFFDYNKTRESSERNLKDRKKDLYKSVILKQRPQTVAKEKEKESGGESDGLFDLEGADPKYNYTNVPDEMSFSESLAWNDSRIEDKKSETFFRFRDNDDDALRSVEKRSNFRFDRWKEPNDKLGSSESQASPIESKNNIESKDSKESKEEEGKSEKEKSRFFIEITDVNTQTSSILSSARTPPKRLLSRRYPEKEVSPMSTENDKNPGEVS